MCAFGLKGLFRIPQTKPGNVEDALLMYVVNVDSYYIIKLTPIKPNHILVDIHSNCQYSYINKLDCLYSHNAKQFFIYFKGDSDNDTIPDDIDNCPGVI